jgi:hypothetical protein
MNLMRYFTFVGVDNVDKQRRREKWEHPARKNGEE